VAQSEQHPVRDAREEYHESGDRGNESGANEEESMKLIKRGRLYWLDLRVGGKRHRVSLHTDEYGLALERARDKAAELRAGAGGPGAGVSLREFAAKYME
jgi:hypothetical protein